MKRTCYGYDVIMGRMEQMEYYCESERCKPFQRKQGRADQSGTKHMLARYRHLLLRELGGAPRWCTVFVYTYYLILLVPLPPTAVPSPIFGWLR